MAGTIPSKESARIVVGVDFSPQSRQALSVATQMARDVGADIVLVHAFAPPGAAEGIAGAPRTRDQMAVAVHDQTAEAVQLSSQWAEQVREEGVGAEVVARESDPAALVLETARNEDASMIVVGTHGRTGLRRVLLGSVAEQVIRGSDRPVLAVPASGA